MTNEEIVKALRCCAQSDCSSCGMCPIFPDRECVEHLAAAAASLIERLAVWPCKVGDVVFARLDNKSKYVCECKVKQIVVGNIGFVTFAPIGAPEREYDVALRGFGKTVFLTREEAERALMER